MVIDIELLTTPKVIELDLELGTIVYEGGGPPYEGEYDVTPKINEQKLKTKGKTMKKDVTVYSIPYSEVSNPEGGETVNIAFE